MHRPEDILSRINDAVWVVDLATRRFIYTNPRFAEIWENPVVAFHTSFDDWIECIYQEDLEYYKNKLKNIETEKNACIEYRIIAGTKTKWVYDNIQFSNKNNCPKGLLTGILSNFTKRKEGEQELKKSEETYRYLFAHNPNPLWIFDIDSLKFLAVNNAAVQNYGYSEEEFLNMSIKDIRPSEDLEKLSKYLKIRVENYVQTGAWRHKKKDGTIIWVDISTHPMIYKGLMAEMVLPTDVSKWINASDEIIRKKKLLSSLINSHTNFLQRCDPKGYITFANNPLINKLEYPEDELVGSHYSKTTLPQDFFLCKKIIDECVNHPGRIFSLDHRKITASGKVFWTSWEIVAITNPENAVIEIQGVGRDISDEIKNKENLELNEKNLNSMINNIHDMIWSVDKNYLLISANNAFKNTIYNLTGNYPQLGKKIITKKLRKNNDQLWAGYYNKALSGKAFSTIETSPIDNGKLKKVSISFNPIRDINNKPIGVSCIAQDITERSDFEDQILSQNKTLTEIASIASHEIRGPVASMMGLISLLDKSNIKGDHNSEILDYMEKAMIQLDSVIHIIVKKSAQIDP